MELELGSGWVWASPFYRSKKKKKKAKQGICTSLLYLCSRDYGPAVWTLGFLVLFCLLHIDDLLQKVIGTLLELPGHWQDFVMREE